MVPRMSVVRRPSQGSPVSFKRRQRKKAAPSSEPCRICSARKAARLLPTPTRHRASRQKPLINYPLIYGNHAIADIEALIRRSQIELADYEQKQGYLTLAGKREVDKNVIDKVIRTICAIANNGPNRMGKIIIGVTDKPSDAQRITELDKITPKKVGNRFVVGVRREAIALTKSLEDYLATWKNAIKNST